MAEKQEEVCLRLQVLNPQHQPLGGTVDVACKLQSQSDEFYIHAADASHNIDVRGLKRDTSHPYEVTVTPTGTSLATTQVATVPTTGFATVQFVIDVARSSDKKDPSSVSPTPAPASTVGTPPSVPPVVIAPPPVSKSTLTGHLVFDYGLPATGITTVLYNVGFGGQDTLLGRAITDAEGNYSISYAPPASGAANLQVRVLDSTGKEVTLSTTLFNASQSETLNLVVPSRVKPLTPEFSRFAADMSQSIGGVASLAEAQENASRQDLTLVNQSTNWDARLAALGALSAQHAATTGINQQGLYAMFRAALPTGLDTLAAVSPATVQAALTTANSAGIASMNDKDVAATVSQFTNFANQYQLAGTAPGGVSTFGTMLSATLSNSAQQSAFANLYFSNPSATDLWTGAASLGINAQTLNALKLQGKFLYLTFNNVALANALQSKIGQIENLSQLADKDFDLNTTWQSTLQGIVPAGGTLDALIPSIYTGATADRLAAYTGDLARKVRISFPTQVVARMIERNQLAVSQATAAPATAFLRAASQLGYSLGTPLNAFIANSAGQLPTLDANSLQTVKTLHRLYQITPSTESFQAALNLGFTSARQIASMSKENFVYQYGSKFPPGEAQWVYGRAQSVSSVTSNICSSAVAMDTAPPVYTLSASSTQKQAAKSALIEQFPSIAALFGNMDYCECQDCSSVLSPAAYFVDVLEFLGPPNPATGAAGSAANAAGYTPLDILIGTKNGAAAPPAPLPGRRPDLGALPLTCENTNTAMPYIDLVNEILEYFIVNQHLDANLAYDTGTATTAELTAEPQNILPQVYNTTLKQALFPLDLPFDLWIETVRGFLNYFKTPLAKVLDTLRPVDALELFTDANNYPYYRAQIFAESLGLSPSDYEVLTGTASGLSPVTTNWFELYGYPSAAAALNGTATLDPLSSAENLAQVLGLTYQQVTDLLETRFLNPGLYPLIYQFQRLGIDMSDAFSYTGQPGYPALANVAAFEAQLNAITARYKASNSATSFNAITWLKSVLPANYSSKVLVLADPDSGCNFGATTLQYADNKTPAAPLDFLKFNLFVRLWQKLGWTMGEVDRALQAFFPANLPAWTDPGFDAAFTAAWKTALVYLAHLDALNTQLAPAMGRDALLPLWANLPVQGPNPLYGQLFVNSSVLNNDWAFDDPAGNFPVPVADLTAASLQTFSAHLASIQGVLGLASDDITAIFADAGSAADTASGVPTFTLNNLSICYRYSTLAKCLGLDVEDMISLKQMSGLNPFQAVSGLAISQLSDDVLFNTTLLFVQEAQAVQNSSFAVEDLQYLLRNQFDPVGKYQVAQNALLTLLQQTASGLGQIQSQNALPANLMSMPETLVDQMLSTLIPTAILKSLFALLTNAQDLTATQSGFATAIDPTPFAAETELSFSYDSTTQIQSVTYTGLLLDWKKAELLAINSSTEFSALLNGVQQQASVALGQNLGNILGVWASLAEYEAVETGATTALPTAELLSTDPALSLSYDAVGQLQWAGYRGVLTDANKSALTAVAMPSPALATLLSNILNDLQSQALPAYSQLAGSLLAMLTNVQSFEASATGVTAANQVDANGFFSALATAQQNGTITGPVPALQFSYDATSQIQTISCQGVLSDALRGQLAALPGLSATTTGLLQSVRDSMVALFETLASGLLTVAATDLDNYAAPFLGLDATSSQRQAKAELIQVFLPLQAQSLSLAFILQTLSSNLSSDPSLTQALVIDTALLSDPSNPGKALLGSFLGLAQPGVSASYSAGSTLLASGIAATPDTSDPTNSVAGATSCTFTGYLQVPTDGPYRFFAELGNIGATALFNLTAPSSSALLANPVIPSTAATVANDEISQFVTLQGGVFYQFNLTFSNLGSGGARLLIQGENMAKGPLSQIVLCPQTSADDFLSAYTLLAKALQILETTGIDQREISYMIANAPLFSNLRFSSLPTQPSDANMLSLFAQMLTLIDYADLRKNPAGGTDGLIDVFQGVGTTFQEVPPGSLTSNTNSLAPWTALANLTRRNVADVRAIATFFGLIQDQVTGSGSSAVENVEAIGDFGDNKGIRRIWQALQLIQILGIPVSAVTACTGIAALAPPASAPAPNLIAANLKNAVKAQYTSAQWLPIAQSVFDPLRKMKRDALVAYLVNALDLESENQLFEYFLVDPGMEPVVQTSRLRLAMSSVQLFGQRCLLNLESDNANAALNVSPSAIDADWWSWMKRYRVWQANREIFLYPENWMEPEMRTGMTDLFESLESDLLQGDVTDDLANQAFLNYLTGLEQRARLDVVASYLDQNLTDAGISTLHVLGRTYSHPHKYFYRTYSSGVWTGWEAVSAKIEGDHIALAVWKGRLNLFWVTYIMQAQSAPPPPTGGKPVTSLGIGDIVNGIVSSVPTTLVQPQLHWCEYYQGKWSTPIASDTNKYQPVPVGSGFIPSQIYIRITKDLDASGNEGALKVHLDFPTGSVADPNYIFALELYFISLQLEFGFGVGSPGPFPEPSYSFRITSKNCDLVLNDDFYNYAPMNPYDAPGVDATLHTGSGSLTSQFPNDFTSSGPTSTTTEPILQTVNSFALLSCSNPVVASPFLDPSQPDYVQAGSLVSPFFYKDTSDIRTTDEMTFYVQPSLTETTVTEWTGWAVPYAPPNPLLNSGEIFKALPIVAQVPTAGPSSELAVDQVHSLYSMASATDWLTTPTTTVLYNGTIVGKSGGINAATTPAVNQAGTFAPNKALAVASSRVAPTMNTVVGPSGLTGSQVQAIAKSTKSNRPATASGPAVRTPIRKR